MKENKTILFISNSSLGYGADKSMIQVINKFKNENYKCIAILASEGRTTDLLKENGIEYYIIPFKNWMHYDLSFVGKYIKPIIKIILNKFLALYTFIKMKNKYKIDFIYSNSFTNFYSYYLSDLFKAKHIQHIREFGDNDFNWKFDFGKKKTVQYAVKKSEFLICISNAVRDCFLKEVNNKEKIITIYNGLPITKEISHNYYSKELKIIFIGRISFEKRQKVMLDALIKLKEKNINNIFVDFYGDGEEINTLINYCKENNISDSVEFLGYQSKIDYSPYNLAVICSNSEGFGRVTVDYMINSLAVIGANGGATPEIIKDDETGKLFKVDNAEDLANKIEELLNDRNKLEQYGINGRKRAIESFSDNICLDKIYNLICE